MIYYVSFGIIVLLFVMLFVSLRKGVIETKYSILWFFTFLVLGFISLFHGTIEKISELLKIHYAPSVLFLFGILFIIILVFDLTRRISKLNKQVTDLIQEHAILKTEIDSKREKK